MNRNWVQVDSKVGYAHPFFKVREDRVLLPNGHEVPDYTVWESGDVAQVVPVTSAGSLLMVKQYKHGLGEQIEEFPGGFVDRNETPFEAANRELSEETGYHSSNLSKLGTFIHHPTKETGKLHLFIALDVQKQQVSLQQDVTEDIELVFYTPEEVLRKISSGSIMQTGSMLGLLLYLHGFYDAS